LARISPLEPGVFEGELWIGGIPGTYKLRDLARDPRFSPDTATIDSHVSEGDAKLWRVVTMCLTPRYSSAMPSGYTASSA
jgi:hypothetical protein